MAHISDKCWRDFADAIVLSAVDDWRRSQLQLHYPSLTSKRALDMTKSCERFFRSSYFETLTGVDGKTFIRHLKDGFNFQ